MKSKESLLIDYEQEERAAILEYDGGWPRAKAEIRAKQEIRERQKHETTKDRRQAGRERD